MTGQLEDIYMTEKELILALKRGDVFALEATIEKYAGYVMAVVQHTLGKSASEEDKEELVSDTFITLWEKAKTLDDNSNLKSWLAVVSRNASINKLRTIRPSEELQEDTLFTDDSIVTLPAEKDEQAKIIREAIDSLTVLDRNLFIRHYYWQQSISVIAEETGMNPSTVKSHLFRGRKVLKTLLVQYGDTFWREQII